MANVPIYTSQGGKQMTIGADATLTIEGDLQVAGGGAITPGANSITTAMIQDDAVTTAKIDDEAVTTAKLGLQAVDDTILADDAVVTAKILDANVTTAKIEDQGVTFAKSLVFISTEQTADGMAQNVAHGLGVDPTGQVLVVPSSNVGLMDAEFDIAFTADMTNVTVTATSGLTYYVMAWG